MQKQADAATAAAQAAAAEAAQLSAKYDTTIAQLQQLLEQQGAEAGDQLAELHARADTQQQRLAGLTQQLCNLLQLPQQLQQQPISTQPAHQTYSASAGGTGPGSAAGSPVRASMQQQWQGSPAASCTWSPSRLATQQPQQPLPQQPQQHQQQATLPSDVAELCSTLSAAVGAQSQPEDVAGAVQALVSGLTQVLLGLVGHTAELEAALAEAQAEGEQLLADGTALAGRLQVSTGQKLLVPHLGKAVQWLQASSVAPAAGGAG
jgi:hypothetical protein